MEKQRWNGLKILNQDKNFNGVKMDKNQLKKKVHKERILKYFIEAAVGIIDEEGMDAVTIRKVADRAGYNSATLYNYFDNLDHLLFFASLKFITPYTENLADHIQSQRNALERNFAIWRYFFKSSFENPKIYQRIFFHKLENDLPTDVSKYYEIYPQDLSETDDGILEILRLHDIQERTKIMLEFCVEEGFLKKEDVNDLAEMTILLYQGMLNKSLKSDNQNQSEELVEKAMEYIKICYEGFLLKI